MAYHFLVPTTRMPPIMKDQFANRRRKALQAFMDAHGLNPKMWAERAKISPNTIYNFLNKRSESLSQQVLEKLASSMNKPVSQIIGESPLQAHSDVASVSVIGEVQSGTWREALEWALEDQYAITVPVMEYIDMRRFALINRGLSMDQYYPDGAYLVCVPIDTWPEALKSGDHVICERRSRDGLVEATCKELLLDGADAWLLPKSSRPEFQPMKVSWPLPTDEAEEIRVTAVVEGTYIRRR